MAIQDFSSFNASPAKFNGPSRGDIARDIFQEFPRRNFQIRNRIFGWTFGLLALATCVAIADEPANVNAISADEKAAGFVSMFNGQDFTGWQFDGGESPPKELPVNWKVADGVIRLFGGGRPNLGTDKSYGDFEMKFEWRSLQEKYNSGFFIRTGRTVGTNQLNLAKGSEGAFIGGKITGAKPVPTLQKPSMEWNEWRVLVVGDKVTFWCNGQLAWEGTGLAAKEGHIGLQAEGAAMEFRKLRIREIKIGVGTTD